MYLATLSWGLYSNWWSKNDLSFSKSRGERLWLASTETWGISTLSPSSTIRGSSDWDAYSEKTSCFYSDLPAKQLKILSSPYILSIYYIK